MIAASCGMSAQNLSGNEWRINTIIGWDTLNTQEYLLTRTNENLLSGDVINFNADNTFEAHYVAPCGNDCFPSSVGTYSFTDKDHIRINIHQLDRKGDCETLHKK
jgi:hypothetical protein